MELLEKIRLGDKEAIKQVYKENSKEVLEFAESITNDHDSALDVTKKTFVKLFSSIQGGQAPVNLRLTALKIAHDEACKIVMPSNPVVKSPYEERDSEVGELEKAVGNNEKDEAMGETRVISLPREAIEELVEDKNASSKAIEDIGNEEIPTETTVRIPREYVEDIEEDSFEEEGFEEDGGEIITDDEFYDQDEEYDDDYDDYEEDGKKRSKGVFVICLIINIILILLLIWFVVGLLINLGIIPEINLGYSWFNEHIANIF